MSSKCQDAIDSGKGNCEEQKFLKKCKETCGKCDDDDDDHDDDDHDDDHDDDDHDDDDYMDDDFEDMTCKDMSPKCQDAIDSGKGNCEEQKFLKKCKETCGKCDDDDDDHDDDDHDDE